MPALSISEPKRVHGTPNAAELKKKQEAYNNTDYHQPSDEYDPSWDFSGAVEDMRCSPSWRGGSRRCRRCPRYNDGDQFANARQKQATSHD